jgi:uncharacterized protein (DUF2236 family)
MRVDCGTDRASHVSQTDLEALLGDLSGRTINPNAGIFGPDSVGWRIDRESALFLGAGRAALLQLAHPWVATALAQHSSLLAKPIARFHNTFRIVFTMVFGSLHQALAASRHLYALHTQIRGELSEPVAGWPRGAHYEANEIAALQWVYATLVESAVLAYECALEPLSAAQCERYYSESKALAGLCGIPPAALPENWEAFAAYNLQMHASDALGVNSAARAIANSLLAGSGSWLKPPFWYRALTIEWLPERFRTEFALPFAEREQRAAERARRRLPRIYRSLPSAVRFIGPWREAQARLAGRRAEAFTRLSNRFWIGQAALPFALPGR